MDNLIFVTVPRMLEECLKYLEDESHPGNESSYEVIIVDDGSKDKTTEVALNYSKKFGCDKVRVLSLTKNRGKGGAVRLVNGHYLLLKT